MKKALLVLTALTFLASPCWAAGVKLTIQDGRVSLEAEDATLRQILTEWARVGKTRIINLERITTGPVTLQFEGVPEAQALDILLRAVPGYLAAPRATLVADASVYDRIVIMATTTAVAPRPPTTASFQNPLSVTQLRRPVATEPDAGLPDLNDPAIANAAAAGLVPTQGNPYGVDPATALRPLMPPGSSAPPATTTPATGSPNPFVPAGAAMPGLAPPAPAPSSVAGPQNPLRPPVPDR